MTTTPLVFHTTPIGVSAWHRQWVEGQLRGSVAVPCGDCSACCRAFANIPLGTLDDASLYRTRDHHGAVVLERHDDGSCIYLVNNQCSIYDRRPHTCRTFDCRIFYPLTTKEATSFGGKTVRDLHHVAHQRFRMDLKEPDDFTFSARLKARFARISLSEIREAGATSFMQAVLLSLSSKAERLWRRGQLHLPEPLKTITVTEEEKRS